jgi:hypothetical protein
MGRGVSPVASMVAPMMGSGLDHHDDKACYVASGCESEAAGLCVLLLVT